MSLFRTVTTPLTLFVGNAKVVHFGFPYPDGSPQNLTGRTFAWVTRRRMLTSPLIEPIAMTLSGDALYASVPIAAEQVAMIQELGAGYQLDWDVIETTSGASTTRWTGALRVQPSTVLPDETEAAPSWQDLPYAEIMSQADAYLISERGAMGPGLEQRLKDLGDIPEADPVLARDKIRAWGAEGGAPFAETAIGKAAEAVSAAVIATDAEAVALTAAARSELAEESVATEANAKDTIAEGRASVAVGELFRAFDANGTIRTYRKTGETTQDEKRVSKSSPLIDAERDEADLAVKRTSRPSPPMARDFKEPIVDSPLGPVDYIDRRLQRRIVEGAPQPSRPFARNGWSPLIVGDDPEGDDWPLFWDAFRDMIGIPRPLLQRLNDTAAHGGFATLQQVDGDALGGIFWGRTYSLQDRRLAGPIIMGDDNQVDQIFDVIEGKNGDTLTHRQLTFSQHGVSAYEVVYWPSATAHGLLRVSVRDQNALTSRHKVRYAVWPRTVSYQPSVPAKMIYIVGDGQSLAMSAGSFDSNPSGVGGPQTTKPQQSLRYGISTHRNVTWNGGTMPHQGDLNGQHIVEGGGFARDVAIDPARIDHFVPMIEGLGQDGAHEDGGWRRESIFSALAAQLNAPHNYNGSVYVAGASFGFGSVAFQDLIWDGTSLKQSVLNALASITRAKQICDANGITLEVHWYINHGQANQSDTTYKSRLAGGWAAIKAATQAITGQATPMQLWLTQNTASRGTFAEPGYSALAQVEFAVETPDVHLLPPDYFTDYETDVVHMKAPEYQWCGQLWGEVIADWLIRGQDASLHMTAASWSGSTMRLTYNHPIMLDPHNVVLGSNSCGAGHANLNGATRTISRGRLDPTSPQRLLLDMSSAIPADAVEVARMAYGNQTSPAAQTMGWGGGPTGGGQRSIIRRADWGERFGVIDGRPLVIFAPIQQLSATKE